MIFADMKKGCKINFISSNHRIFRFSIKMEQNKKSFEKKFYTKELNIICIQDCCAHISHYIITFVGYSKAGQVKSC